MTTDAGEVEFKMLDVSNLGSVRQFAGEFKAAHDKIDLLITNAGIMAVPFAKTVDGYECQFVTNRLGHFLLKTLRFPLLKQSSSSRVVNVANMAHTGASFNRFESGSGVMRTSDEDYRPMEVYSESKLCNLLFTFQLDRRLRAQNVTGVTSVRCHPGFSASNLAVAPGIENKGFLWRIGQYLGQYLPIKGGDYDGPGNYFEIWGHPSACSPKPP